MNNTLTPPKNQQIWTQYIKDGVVKYVVTSDMVRSEYFLYKVEGDKLVKTNHKAKNPLDLEKFII